MTLPIRYSCDPPWWIIIWNTIAAIAVLVLLAVGWLALTPGMTVASVLILLVLLLVFRRIAYKKYVELSDDTLILPAGFLQLQTNRIPYSTIDRVWESHWAFGPVLYLSANKRKYEIPCGIRLERSAYVSVRDFLIKEIILNKKNLTNN